MNCIYLVDDEPERAASVRRLFEERSFPAPQIIPLNELEKRDCNGRSPVVLVHWSVLERAFPELSRVRSMMGRLKIIFFCFCREKRTRDNVLLLPEELDEMIHRIRE